MYGDRLPLIIAIIAIAIALYTHVCPTQHHNPENVRNDVKDLNNLLAFTDRLFERLSSVKSSLNDITQITTRLENIEEDLKKLELVAYKADVVNLVRKEELENRLTATKNEMSGQIDLNIEKMQTVLEDEVQKLKDEVGIKFGAIKDMGQEQKELQTNMMTLKEKLDEQSQFSEKENAEAAKEMPQPNETLRGLKASVEILTSNVRHVAENMTRIFIETLVLNKKINDIKENESDKGSFIVVIMINTSLLVLVIIYLVVNSDTNRQVNRNVDIGHQHSNDGVNQNPASYSTAGEILRQVRAHPRLERKLCIISFYEETHTLHMRMTQSVTQQLNLDPVGFIIRRHEDILRIPPVSLYFTFVDFNEQNVIIEDPTIGLGDLRVTTVQAIQAMGGRIVIFYVRDPNSRQLNYAKLYNEDLASVTRQRELSALNRLSRFISAYYHLTDFQKSHLRQIVVDTLNGH